MEKKIPVSVKYYVDNLNFILYFYLSFECKDVLTVTSK